MIEKYFDNIDLKIFNTREEMGYIGAKEAAKVIKELLLNNDEINMVFAAAPSQQDFLDNLISYKDIEWNRINAYHMDEYIGLEIGSKNSFSRFLMDAIFNKVPFKSINLINGMNEPQSECERYTKLINDNPPDIIVMGIGENGHIAFNDPDVADFNDPYFVKIVELDEISRNQQVNDGCFDSIDNVPKKAITLTIPTLTNCENIFCIVPTKNKAKAVKDTLTGEISTICPASILRTVNNVKMYIDSDAASLL